MDVNYLAGYVDGEGCIYLYNSPNRPGIMCGLTISGCYKPIFEELHAEFGGTFCPVSTQRFTTKQAWTWQVQGEKAFQVCCLLQPYLYEKRDQADLLIEFWKWRHRQPKRGVSWSDVRHMVTAMKQLKRIEWE